MKFICAAVKRFFMRQLFSLLLLIAFALSPFSAGAAEVGADAQRPASDLDYTAELELYAAAAYLVNLETGRVIYRHNSSTRVAPASTTKIMTSALALSLCEDPENTVITLPDDLWEEFYGIDISHAGLLGGEELTLEQLVHCMMLQSANEAASGVASHFGSQAFIDLMNNKAAELGCSNTHFVNPHGLYDPDHYTTAEDLFRITKWALSVPGFYEIACKARYELPETNKNYEKTLATSILMQDKSSAYYTSYIRGIKTGTLEQSGRCLVSTAEKNGMSFCLVLMGCPMENTATFWEDGRSVFNETRVIYDWLFDNAALINVVSPDTVTAEIALRYAAKKDSIILYPLGELYAIVRRNSETKPIIRYETDLPDFIEAPVSAGQEIGAARVYADDIYLGEVKLISREGVERSWFVMAMDKITVLLTSRTAYIIYAAVIVIVLFYTYYILVLVHRSRRRKGKRSKLERSKK